MSFLYDDSDNMVGFTLNGTSYYYVKNLQGDVIGILDSTGTLVVQYTYDAWGKILSVTDGDGVAITNKSHVAYLNPIRYRGYVYDEEIGMYYLQSRYYDPTTGRFINQDLAEIILEDQGFLGQYNPYAYCGNNPVNMADPYGNIAIITCVIIGACIGLVLGGTAGAVISYKKYKEVRWKYVLIGAVAGAALGAAAGYGIGLLMGASTTTIGTAKSFSSGFKIGTKIAKQMSKRGWTNKLIKDTILKNVGRKALNKATGRAATAYFTSSGAYVVIENATKEIIQISDRYDPKWVVDSTIKLLRSDVFIK